MLLSIYICYTHFLDFCVMGRFIKAHVQDIDSLSFRRVYIYIYIYVYPPTIGAGSHTFHYFHSNINTEYLSL